MVYVCCIHHGACLLCVTLASSSCHTLLQGLNFPNPQGAKEAAQAKKGQFFQSAPRSTGTNKVGPWWASFWRCSRCLQACCLACKFAVPAHQHTQKLTWTSVILWNQSQAACFLGALGTTMRPAWVLSMVGLSNVRALWHTQLQDPA